MRSKEMMMSIELTEQQQNALDAGPSPMTLIDPRSNQVYVLLRAEVYQQVRSLLDDDFKPEDAFQAQMESAAAAGWDDPALDVYNALDPRRAP
jgi:hypothetical protein